MKITKEEVEYVAHLARLECSVEERDRLTVQLNDILLYMDVLGAVDTGDVQPMSHSISVNNAFREDMVRPSPGMDRALANAPDRADHYFRVPKVIE